MKILNEKKVEKKVERLFLQVWKHRGLIQNLDDIERTLLSDYVSLRIHDEGYEPGSEMHKLYAQLNPNLSKEAMQYRLETNDFIEEEPKLMKDQKPSIGFVQKEKSKVCPIWFYAYYHYILETYIDKTQIFPYGDKIKIAEISNKIYKIDGVQFYNEFHKLMKIKVKDSIKNMKPKKRNKLKENIIKLANIYNSPSHIKWWDTTFI